MALTDYSIDTAGTPEDVQRKQKLAELLMQQGSDSSPAAGGKGGGWMTALNRGLAGALGGYQQGQAREEDRTNRAQANAQLIALLGGASQPQSPPMGSIAAPAAPTQPMRPAPRRVASLTPGDVPEAEPAAPAPKPFVASQDSGALPTFGEDGKLIGNLTTPPPAQSGVNPAMAAYLTNPYGNKGVQGALLTKALSPKAGAPYKDVEGNLMQMGPDGTLHAVIQAEKSPTSVKEFEYSKAHPEFAGRPLTPDERKSFGIPANSAAVMTPQGPKVLGAGNTIINNAVNPALKDLSEQFATSRGDANNSADTIRALHNARSELDKSGGIIAGSGANERLALQKVGSLLGVANPDAIVNTETFRTQIKPIVLSTVKGLGAGSGISNADREFAEKAAGGDITLDENSIRRVLDITERAARSKIERHNKLGDQMRKTQPDLEQVSPMLTIEQPPEYKPPQFNDRFKGSDRSGGIDPGALEEARRRGLLK